MKLISEIKLKTKSLKDKRKNILKLIKCSEGKIEPDCYFSCKRYEDFKKMDARGQSCYYINLLDEYNKLTKQIDIVGKSILEFRGNKWSF